MSNRELSHLDREHDKWRAQLEAEALADPNFDFFAEYKPRQPKYEIGEYVRANGFYVPLIETDEEWQEALDDGLAMVRSEHEQDYTGYSGLLSSKVLSRGSLYSRRLYSSNRYEGAQWRNQLDAILFEGLRSGDLSPASYMETFVWPEMNEYWLKEFSRYRMEPKGLNHASASRWRYVPGTNITLFRDPTVDGSYHIRIHPDSSFPLAFDITPEYYHKSITYERSGRPVPMGDVIEFYESIRSLPLFDIEQAPVMEIQMDLAGKFHFLQYFKSGHRVNPIDPFFIHAEDDAVFCSDVRGATGAEGEELKLYMSPKRLHPDMEGQAFYVDGGGSSLGTQLMSRIGSIIVQPWYLSMRDTHFSSAPMYRPDVAIGLGMENYRYEQMANWLVNLSHGRRAEPGYAANVYVHARITANGQHASIETDWEPHFEGW